MFNLEADRSGLSDIIFNVSSSSVFFFFLFFIGVCVKAKSELDCEGSVCMPK